MEMQGQLLRVPLERLQHRFVRGHRAVEVELGLLERAVKPLTSGRGKTASEAIKSCDTLLHRLDVLRRKLEESVTQENSLLELMTERVSYLAMLPTTGGSRQPGSAVGADGAETSASQSHGQQKPGQSSNRLVVSQVIGDWLLRRGFLETAQQMARLEGVSHLLEFDLFREMQTVIQDLLRNHSTKEALAWCAEHRKKLKKAESLFEYELQFQEFLQQIRHGVPKVDVIRFFQQKVRPLISHVENPECLERPPSVAMTALVFSPDTACAKYKEILSDTTSWQRLVRIFTDEACSIFGVPRTSLMELCVQSGLSSMKSPFCTREESHTLNCPVCDPLMNALARPLPFAMYSHSSLVCQISGKIMDYENPPMMLPNGRVYSQQALEDAATENGGEVVCPQTGDSFLLTEAKKLFITS